MKEYLYRITKRLKRLKQRISRPRQKIRQQAIARSCSDILGADCPPLWIVPPNMGSGNGREVSDIINGRVPGDYPDTSPSTEPTDASDTTFANTALTEEFESSPSTDDTESISSPRQDLDAQEEYTRAFPSGYKIIPTPADGLLCGFAAVILSLQAMHPYLPCPTIADLQDILKTSWFQEYTAAFGMTNENNFSIDQVASVLYCWGYNNGVNLRIGVVPEGECPMLMPHPNEWAAHILWIHNDGLANDEGRLGHYSGMRPKEIEEINEDMECGLFV